MCMSRPLCNTIAVSAIERYHLSLLSSSHHQPSLQIDVLCLVTYNHTVVYQKWQWFTVGSKVRCQDSDVGAHCFTV